jgi:hypothetical protein
MGQLVLDAAPLEEAYVQRDIKMARQLPDGQR